MKKIALVLMNLGGPDQPAAVQPFLFNLFNDPAIIRVPFPFRWLLARFISTRRAPEAQEIYEHLGGGSPLLANTQAQAQALEEALKGAFPQETWKVFVAMRYWHPLTEETVAQVQEWDPTEVFLLPLYPHFSTTTTQSSLREWEKRAHKKGLHVPTKSLCCYPTHPRYIKALGDLLQECLGEWGEEKLKKGRILFSAHGLPKRVIEGGDPYASQIEQTAQAVMEGLSEPYRNLEWRVSYQSRVGPLEWIGPFTDQEIIVAGKEGKGILVVPISFVSEHSETLVELDIQYADLARQQGVPFYHRVPTPQIHPLFIQSLVDLVQEIRYSDTRICSQENRFICDPLFHQCPKRNNKSC